MSTGSCAVTTRTDVLHDALDRLAGYDYLDGAGFPCHGSIGAGALGALGLDDEVPGWVDAYTSRHAPIAAPPLTERRIDPDDGPSWRPALGDFSRVADWAAMFREMLWNEPWPAVLRRWAARLLPGYGGGLTHGLLRTAHAVRAMPTGHSPSGVHLDELAKGLAAWAAWYRELPGPPSLTGLPGPPVGLSDLSAAFCRTLLANPEAVAQGLVHAVTPIAAARTLLPYLPEPAADVLVAHLWHVGTAIVVAFTPAPSPAPPARPDLHLRGPIAGRAPLRPDELIARAIEHRDTHVLELTEACAREHALNPDPVYLYAAQHLLARTPPW
jgi:hypothetical protein